MGWMDYTTSWSLSPRERDPVPLYRRLVRPQGRSGRVRKISPPPEFDPRTVQPVASSYTDWAIAAQIVDYHNIKLSWTLEVRMLTLSVLCTVQPTVRSVHCPAHCPFCALSSPLYSVCCTNRTYSINYIQTKYTMYVLYTIESTTELLQTEEPCK
jgi:hypothetical protein